ncbi:MAG: BON domain-containing protein [Isosphaeraceae bacterium]
MKKVHGVAVTVALAVFAFAAWSAGTGRAQQEGPATKAGERLDQFGRKVKKSLDRAEGAVREGFHKTRDSVHSMGVAARIYGRLHWDKALTTSNLNVKVEEGVATISGSVPTADARIKAVTLTAETVGVHKVIDELTIPASQADAPASKSR